MLPFSKNIKQMLYFNLDLITICLVIIYFGNNKSASIETNTSIGQGISSSINNLAALLQHKWSIWREGRKDQEGSNHLGWQIVRPHSDLGSLSGLTKIAEWTEVLYTLQSLGEDQEGDPSSTDKVALQEPGGMAVLYLKTLLWRWWRTNFERRRSLKEIDCYSSSKKEGSISGRAFSM